MRRIRNWDWGATLAVQDALFLAGHVQTQGPVTGALAFSKKRLPAVRAYQALGQALNPCFQAECNGLGRDVVFACGLHIPGVQRLMHRSVAEPPTRDEVLGGEALQPRDEALR